MRRPDWTTVLIALVCGLLLGGAGGLKLAETPPPHPRPGRCSEPAVQAQVDFYRDRYWEAVHGWRVESRRARIYRSVLGTMGRRLTLPSHPPADTWGMPLWRSQR